MERRVLLAITLSFLVLFLFQRFVMPPPAPLPGAPAATQNQNASASAPTAPASPTSLASPGSSASPGSPAPPIIASTVSETNAREIVVETSKVKAVFSNRGAKLVHWILKEYRSDAGHPLDLIPAGAGP